MNGAWYAIYFTVLAWSGAYPRDRFTWLLEVLPALLAVIILTATRTRFRFTGLAYGLILVHCLILMVGGHYTYAEEPTFSRLRDLFGWDRNNYDKVGHFAQGFVPAIVVREVLVRLRVVQGGTGWLFFITASICLAISALYELFEWSVSVMTGEAAESFLGTQGYAWDTQSDMAFALLGAMAALQLLYRAHDRQLAAVSTGGELP